MSIKESRERLGLNQRELARRSGVDTPTLCKAERGRILLNESDGPAVARVLGVPVHEVYECIPYLREVVKMAAGTRGADRHKLRCRVTVRLSEPDRHALQSAAEARGFERASDLLRAYALGVIKRQKKSRPGAGTPETATKKNNPGTVYTGEEEIVK